MENRKNEERRKKKHYDHQQLACDVVEVCDSASRYLGILCPNTAYHVRPQHMRKQASSM
jgi:hypothetical protein